MTKRLMIVLLLTAGVSLLALERGAPLPSVTLQGDHGGTSSGAAWHSSSLKGKVHILLYMDPDKRKAMMRFLDRLNKKRFNPGRYSTVAIVNLAATWMPDAVLTAMLRKKEKDLYHTEFVFDKKKVLVKRWHLADDDTNVIVCDARGRVLYLHRGPMDEAEIDKVLRLVERQI
ncbi:YtfJ family protein [Nitratifractor sp.]